tara:strand:- start:12 stop:233 length:222 start_codon:yes stop_codon:yes gene_type:complete
MAKVSKNTLYKVDLIIRDRDHFYNLVSTSNRIFGHGKWRTQRNTLYKIDLGGTNIQRKWFVPDLTAATFLKLL